MISSLTDCTCGIHEIGKYVLVYFNKFIICSVIKYNALLFVMLIILRYYCFLFEHNDFLLFEIQSYRQFCRIKQYFFEVEKSEDKYSMHTKDNCMSCLHLTRMSV